MTSAIRGVAGARSNPASRDRLDRYNPPLPAQVSGATQGTALNESKVRNIFELVLAKPPEARAAHLDRLCGETRRRCYR